MSKTALVDAIQGLDFDAVRRILEKKPALKNFETDRGWNLLQFCCTRRTVDDRAAADRQVRIAKWLINEGFDPHVTYATRRGEDGEEDVSELSLVFFAVARAQNNRLVRLLLAKGVKSEGLFAAAWWGNWEILQDLVRHRADLNVAGGATPLHMSVAVLDRGIDGKPDLARRRVKTLEEILRLGADPNLGDYRGDKPLHTALSKGYDVAVFRTLLKYGANPDVPGREGRTVREMASKKRDKRYFKAIPKATVK
jgi:hypothetical protein